MCSVLQEDAVEDLKSFLLVFLKMRRVLPLVVCLFSLRLADSQQVQHVPGLLLWNLMPIKNSLREREMLLYVCLCLLTHNYLCFCMYVALDPFSWLRSFRSLLRFSPHTFEGLFKRWSHLPIFTCTLVCRRQPQQLQKQWQSLSISYY